MMAFVFIDVCLLKFESKVCFASRGMGWQANNARPKKKANPMDMFRFMATKIVKLTQLVRRVQVFWVFVHLFSHHPIQKWQTPSALKLDFQIDEKIFVLEPEFEDYLIILRAIKVRSKATK